MLHFNRSYLYLLIAIVCIIPVSLFSNVVGISSFPIELLSFEVRLIEGAKVELSWTTATEKSNSYFEIEKSVDGQIWESVGKINGAINSAIKRKYSFIDLHPYAQQSYYRLKQVDQNERVTRSPKISLDLSGQLEMTIDIYPNPCQNEITIQGPSEELQSLEVYDLLGRKIDFSSIITYVNANKIILDLTLWQPGIYIFRTKNEIRKVIKN